MVIFYFRHYKCAALHMSDLMWDTHWRLCDCRSLQWSSRSVRWATNHQLLSAMLQKQHTSVLVWRIHRLFRRMSICAETVLTHLQSLITWCRSNSKADSRMMSRGSGGARGPRNMFMLDCNTNTRSVWYMEPDSWSL